MQCSSQCLVVAKGMPGCVQAFLQHGNKLCSCSKDSHVRVWDLDTQHCSQTLVGFGGEVWALAMDPSQTRLVSGSADANLQVYEVTRQEGMLSGTAGAGQRDTLVALGTYLCRQLRNITRQPVCKPISTYTNIGSLCPQASCPPISTLTMCRECAAAIFRQSHKAVLQ